MKNFNKNLNIAFVGGLVGMAIMTWISPKAINLLFTPPVSFGVNCEPAGKYAMEKLILCQSAGLVIGIILTFWLKSKVFPGKNPETTKTQQ
jgi:hypothetical protein